MAFSRCRKLFFFTLTACLLCTDVTTTDGLSLHVLTAPVVWAFILSWPTALIPWRWPRVAVQAGIAAVVFCLCVIDCYCQEYFRSPVTPQLMGIVLNTDAREAAEFFSVFLNGSILKHWRLPALFALATVFLVVSFLRLRPGRQSFANVWLKRAYVLLLLVCCMYEAVPACHFVQLFTKGTDSQVIEALIFRRYHQEVPTPVHRFAFAYHAFKQTGQMLNAVIESTLPARADSCSHLSPHIVLIIGESYNKHHASLYGYPLPTTPQQQKRQAEGSLTVFSDVVSPWNITSNSFLDIFSLWEVGADGFLGSYPLFPILFRDSGYDVNFFSNQFFLNGLWSGSSNQAGRFFLSNKRLSRRLFSYRNRHGEKYDMDLVEQVEKFKTRKKGEAPYTLDIIHLIGQHFSYAERYPPEMAVFTAADYARRTELDSHSRQVVMHYDNATRYNDLVLDRIIRLYEHEEAIAVFIADHGEEVYDDLPVQGRLYQEPTACQARQEFEIPMWIWCSDRYQERHPDIVGRIRQAAGRPFMTDRLPQLLLHLAAIDSQWNRDTSDLLSDRYRPQPRIIARSADYDRLRKTE